MNKLYFLIATLVASAGSCAQEAGRVLSSTPVVQQVGVPRQVCTIEQVHYQSPKSGAGAVLGALVGGALGSASGGHGAGQAAATVIGAVGGSMVGDRIEGYGPSHTQDVQRCSNQTFYENRTVGYNVVYEYAGKQYSVQMPNDPGPTVALQVSVVGGNLAGNSVSHSQATVVAAPPVFIAQQPVIVRAPQVYYVPSYNPLPFGVHVGVGHWGAHPRVHGGAHFRHWR